MGAPDWDFAVLRVIVAQRPSRRFAFNKIKGMKNLIRGKKAIVTGGTRGIGRAIARMLLEQGAEVAICGRTEASVAVAVKELEKHTGGRVVGQACNVRNLEQIRKFFHYVDDTLISLDILVNNAGIGVFGPVAEMRPEDWQATLETNLTSVFHFTQLALERFRRAGGGFVVNISSLAGKNAFAGGAAYNASKFGLNGFSEALMLDHRAENVRVAAILPGSVSTGFGASGEADWKIQPFDVAEVVRMVLEMPDRTMVSRVEMRPSKPAK
jgi:NAD(P)-dependent dehydrogenase (short-subunit alcohol dehydrogenase family)